jgi:nanoRNase/pAp phosphatase (c-di-AMP/oligoRNAs hydrolase)
LSGRGRCSENGDPLAFASLAALRLILELFVVKKKLFPGGEDKIAPTVDTLQHLVLKFH